MFRKTTLSSGLRVLTNKLESTSAVTVLVLAGAGSRYEKREINGISHFLEHMFFKGAKKFKNSKEVSETIDGVGGDFNAFTGKEYAGYYVKVAREKMEVAFDVLSDMMLNARFDQAEIDKERGVILEEYRMYQDTPMYQIGWNFESLVFGDQPMGWDEVGTEELIKSVSHEDFVKYKSELYATDNIVLVVCGNVEHDEVVAEAEKYFAMEESKKAYDFLPYAAPAAPKKVFLKKKATEQAHLCIGFEGYPEMHPDHWTLKVLSAILGGNMSSRMFLNVREAHGLAYYIHTSTDNYMDTGLISTSAGVDVNRIYFAVEKIVEEYKKVVDGAGGEAGGAGISEEEVKKAQNFLKGKMVLGLEDSEEYAHLLAKYELLHGTPKMPEEIMKEVDKVTLADINRVAADLFQPDRLRLAVIGPYDDPAKFEELLKF